MSFTPDQVTFDTSAAIQYPEIHPYILQMATNAFILAKLFVVDPIVNGNTRTYVKEAGSVSIGIDRKAVGAPSVRDYTPLSEVAVTPNTYGEEVEIPIEMVTDIQVNVIDTQLRRLAYRTAYQIELDCLTAIQGAVSATSQNVSATGKTIGLTGTEFTISGGIGVEDLNKAAAYIESYNFIPKYVLCNPVNKESLRNIPVPSLYHEWVDPLSHEVQEKIGSWVILTSNLMPAGTAYMISDGQNPNNNYAPMGFMVTKQEIVTDIDIQKRLRKLIPFTSYRKTPYITNAYCICGISGLSTTA